MGRTILTRAPKVRYILTFSAKKGRPSMFRYLTVFLVSTVGAYAGTCGVDVPVVSLFVNGGSDLGGAFTVQREDVTGCVYSLSGTVTGAGFTVTFQEGTIINTDPLIDFGLEFSSFDGGDFLSFSDAAVGDVTFSLSILSPYTGGPFTNITNSSTGVIVDVDASGNSYAQNFNFPFNIQTTYLNGVIFDQQNAGCTTSERIAECNDPFIPPANFLADNANPIPNEGTMQVTIDFTLSAGDSYILNGGTFIDAAEVPEPGTITLFGAGILALTGLARLSRKKG